MYIIQMADLHIGSDKNTEPNEKEFVRKSIKLIGQEIPKKSKILLCLCGDIIDSAGLDSGNQEEIEKRYKTAREIIQLYKTGLEDDYDVAIRCCPGNHDITHSEELYNFISAVDEQDTSLKGLKSCYTYEIEEENTYCLFVNSCDGDQYKIGKIDYSKLETELSRLSYEKNKIIVLHHTIMSMFDEDASPIRNAAKLINLVDKYKVIGVLHGHIHGREILKVGQSQCKVIGTGALFTRNNPNINSQFNIIRYQDGIIEEIRNCRYSADGANNPWIINDLSDNSNKENNFEGTSFKQVYEKLIRRLRTTLSLDNVTMCIYEDYDKFDKELRSYLEDDFLKIGDKKYDYFKLGEMWERDEVPSELYFNHGSCFKVDGKSGIKFITEQLKIKPTSNRIVLPAYNMKKVIRSLDDSIYLPSLASLQFGKGEKEDELFIHMHLRALEARRFLKINICEIAYILGELKKQSVEFSKVKIIISAFRVQIREQFNCFLKAKIDEMNAEKLSIKVAFGKVDEICKLLQEKRDGRETITKVQGIQTVYQAMKEANEESESENDFKYTDEIINILEKVLQVYKQLDEIHKASSIRSEKEIDCEEKIDQMLGDLIQKLEDLKVDREGGKK